MIAFIVLIGCVVVLMTAHIAADGSPHHVYGRRMDARDFPCATELDAEYVCAVAPARGPKLMNDQPPPWMLLAVIIAMALTGIAWALAGHYR